jgi:DNA (cytosine-5)-methyltransferase 1
LANLTVGSLFAGIGGFDLAAERAGLEVKWQVEIDDFCNRVLEKHWPHVRRYRDVRTVGAHNLERVDIVCGGFPCQDVSSNNQYKLGVEGERSSLFREALRIAGELQPRYLVLENVADLLVRGMGAVLGELAALGFDAEWECVPAAAFGLPQPRWRVFIIAYPGGGGCQASDEWVEGGSFSRAWLDYDRLGEAEQRAAAGVATLCGMGDGLPSRMDRVRACGNSIVPDVAECIFRRVLDAETTRLQAQRSSTGCTPKQV